MLIQCLREEQGSFHRTASTRLAGLCELCLPSPEPSPPSAAAPAPGRAPVSARQAQRASRTRQAATRRNVGLSSGDVTDAFKAGNAAYFSLKMKDLLIALRWEAIMETDKA